MVVVALVMVSFFGCGRSGEKKMYAGSSRQSAGNEKPAVNAPSPSDKKPAISPDFGEGGGGEQMDSGAIGTEPGVIRPFTDPRTGQTYNIVDGRVIIAFKNPPALPDVDPNYFDLPRNEVDPVYSDPYPPIVGDPAIDSFIAAENLSVYSEWLCIKSLGGFLPPGQTVEDAVAQWPIEYPNIIAAVDPDMVVEADWPISDPNDDRFPEQWAINDDANHDINLQAAWRAGFYWSEVVAELDTGVQRRAQGTDLNGALLSWGINTGISAFGTTFEENGGQPLSAILNTDQFSATHVGHGTCVAGIIAADIDNDPGYLLNDERDICGIADNPCILPVAMFSYEYYDLISNKPKYSYDVSAILNAYVAIGCVKRIYAPWREYYGSPKNVPYANIEVANCSYSDVRLTVAEMRQLDVLTKYILFVCAAGNYSEPFPRWPAAHSRALAVGAYDDGGLKAYYSNLGTVFAPGGERSDGPPDYNWIDPVHGIYTTDMVGMSPNGRWFQGFIPDSGTQGSEFGLSYGFSGTSAAAPVVSAVAGLYANRYRDATPEYIKSHIISGCDFDPQLGYKLNAYRALTNGG